MGPIVIIEEIQEGHEVLIEEHKEEYDVTMEETKVHISRAQREFSSELRTWV